MQACPLLSAILGVPSRRLSAILLRGLHRAGPGFIERLAFGDPGGSAAVPFVDGPTILGYDGVRRNSHYAYLLIIIIVGIALPACPTRERSLTPSPQVLAAISQPNQGRDPHHKFFMTDVVTPDVWHPNASTQLSTGTRAHAESRALIYSAFPMLRPNASGALHVR
jgi:hypothetical protein